jgi:anti-sigma-K factor RskA
MLSEELQLLVAGYVLGDLDPEEAAEFEQFLRENPAIAAEVAQMQAALETTFAVPEVSPPAHLRASILSQAETTPEETNRSTSAPVTLRRPRILWRRVMDVAAAGLILALGINNYRLWQTLQTTQATLQQYPLLTYRLNAIQAGSDASAQVVVNPNRLEATLAVENLPPLPPGKVYALWTVLEPNVPFTTDSKQAILTEVFQVDREGTVSKTISVPQVYRSSGVVTKVAVTIEDATSPQAHTGTPIMITKL